MDLVSVIIPVYKVEEYLERCVSSVVNQTYSNLEILLIDDGSPDQCPALCDAWAEKDSRIKVIHRENGGLSAARNTGLDAATGDYILLVDSDDYVAPWTIEALVSSVVATNSDIAICDYMKGSESGYTFANRNVTELETFDSTTALFRIYSDEVNAFKYAAAWGKLYKVSLFRDIRYPDGKIFEDIYTTHKLLFQADKIVLLNCPMFYYYQRPASIMNSRFNLKKLDYLQALVERVSFFKKHNLTELSQIAYDELLHALIWEYSRTRDILHSREGMDYVMKLFRENYRNGYASIRYPQETKRFLSTFNRNPEWIILYWKISGKLKQLFKKV